MARNGLGSYDPRYGLGVNKQKWKASGWPEMVWEGFCRPQTPESKIQNPKSKIQNPNLTWSTLWSGSK